jgi:hypothetical protein
MLTQDQSTEGITSTATAGVAPITLTTCSLCHLIPVAEQADGEHGLRALDRWIEA